MIFFRYPFRCDLKAVDYEKYPVLANAITHDIESYLGNKQFSLLYNGKQLQNKDAVPRHSTIEVVFSLPGGKGGFGSMLRAIGAQIEKTTNREACRDLSGRRLRDINEEQRLKKWIAKEAEREAEKIKRRQARIERLKNKAPHNFFDFEYEKEISELPSRINDALSEGLQKAKQPSKRPLEQSETSKLPKKSWFSDDFNVTSSDSESDERIAGADSSPSKKPKLAPKDSSSCDSDVSESSQPCPGSSKDSSLDMEESSMSSDAKVPFTDIRSDEISSDSSTLDLIQHEKEKHDDLNALQVLEMKVAQPEEKKIDNNTEEVMEIVKTAKKECGTASKSDCTSTAKEPEIKDDSPIDLLDFQNVSEIEALGLDRLKSALMARGLKCGGTLSDRAQRLWQVRGLHPHEYPANLIAKKKK